MQDRSTKLNSARYGLAQRTDGSVANACPRNLDNVNTWALWRMERACETQNHVPKAPTPPKTKSGFADLLIEIADLYEVLAEKESSPWKWLEGDSLYEADCRQRANAFKVASENILSNSAPAELTEDSLALYMEMESVSNSILKLMEEYIATGNIGLADDLIRVINISSGGVSSYISSCVASCCLACKEDDYDEIDREPFFRYIYIFSSSASWHLLHFSESNVRISHTTYRELVCDLAEASGSLLTSLNRCAMPQEGRISGKIRDGRYQYSSLIRPR